VLNIGKSQGSAGRPLKNGRIRGNNRNGALEGMGKKFRPSLTGKGYTLGKDFVGFKGKN